MAFFLSLSALSRRDVHRKSSLLTSVRWIQMQSSSQDTDLRSQLKELIPKPPLEGLKKLKAEHGKVQLGNITLDMLLGGMRGMIGLLRETSLLDPEEHARSYCRLQNLVESHFLRVFYGFF